MERNSLLESIVSLAPAIPCDYPGGDARRFLDDPAHQPMSLLLGAMAMYGSDSPWALPHGLATRLGMARLDAATVVATGEADLRKAIRGKPALHMDPARMGRWAWDAARLVVGQYGGDANWIWNDFRKMDVGRFVGRLLEVPGIGSVKALVLAFLLHRDWGADIVGWRGFRPPMDAAMLVAAGRLGIGAPESDGDPESIVKVCEGLRKVSKLCAQERPQCGACPLSAGCPRQGV